MASIAERILASSSAVLVAGGERSARTSLLNEIAATLERLGSDARVLTADLGLPFLGPPGAVSRLRSSHGKWELERVEPLCTLDSARFRLPLLLACRRVFEDAAPLPLLVEIPRLTRGMSASETVMGFLETTRARMVLSLGGVGGLQEELVAFGIEVLEVTREKESAVVDRATARTRLWEQFLESAAEITLPFSELALVGAPPPRAALAAFAGRQIALLGERGETLGFGEVLSMDGRSLRARVRSFGTDGEPRALLIRDARRDARGWLSTVSAALAPRSGGYPPLDGLAADGWDRVDAGEPQARESESDLKPGTTDAVLRPPVVTLASAKAFLVNGIFGDPLLHIRLRHRRRSLLFDLGDAARLPARIVHQVSDVFISHAHFDHFGGFLWLLRSSIGSPRPRSLYGPPGLTDHVEGMIAGIHWDRIGDRGPVFVVNELHTDRLLRCRLKAGGKGRERLEDVEVQDGLILNEADFVVRAARLDHGIPVLAFAFEETRALHVRASAIADLGLTAGPWLSLLKRALLEDRRDEVLGLPDGSRRSAAELEEALIFSRAGQKLVYATDLDESEANHRALSALASGARVLYCEASFLDEDRELARATQHLTAKGCARIALSAGVEKLVPFHFSKRYEREPERVYREVMDVFPATMVAR
jgi:ribonuclease BN (tRNA processing enzyme)